MNYKYELEKVNQKKFLEKCTEKKQAISNSFTYFLYSNLRSVTGQAGSTKYNGKAFRTHSLDGVPRPKVVVLYLSRRLSLKNLSLSLSWQYAGHPLFILFAFTPHTPHKKHSLCVPFFPVMGELCSVDDINATDTRARWMQSDSINKSLHQNAVTKFKKNLLSNLAALAVAAFVCIVRN